MVRVVDPAQLFSVNCLIVGDDRKKVFTVEVAKDKNVSILKDEIKKKKAPHLNHIAASDLELSRTSLTVNDKLKEVVKTTPFQPLDPVEPLLSLFQTLEERHLHVVVRAPTKGNRHHLLFHISLMSFREGHQE